MDGGERIAQRAYSIWEREGRPDGRALEHWLSACAEIEGEGFADDKTPETLPASSPRTGRRAKGAPR